MQEEAKQGPGQFQWNFGGWFGSQLGGTLWLLLLGSVLLFQGRLVGALALALGLLSNLVGLLLWRRRNTLLPYPAIQALVGICGVSAVVSMLAISAAGLSEQAFQMSQPLWFLFVFPALMLMFHLQERAALKARASDQ